MPLMDTRGRSQFTFWRFLIPPLSVPSGGGGLISDPSRIERFIREATMSGVELGENSCSNTPINPAQSPDLDRPDNPGHEFAQFGAGCFWGVELAFQRIQGVVKTEVGYSQGHVSDATYKLVCTGSTNHAEVVRIQFDPAVCPYTSLLSLFWSRHDPTTLNRQGGDVGTQYRSGIYYYNEAQARLARESMEAKQREVPDKKIVTEILPAKRFYRAEEYHQQYLEKGGGSGMKQSAKKGCNDPIRCYG